MKKITVFSLLAIFLFNYVGYYIVFKTTQAEIRKEIKTKIKLGVPENELTVIEFSKKDFQNISWVKENKEFYFKNQLFDIVKKEETLTGILLYCIDDKQEHELFAALDDHINQLISTNPQKSNTPSKKLIDHVVKIYFSTNYSYAHTITFHLLSFPSVSSNYSSLFPEIKSPPPRFC